MKKCEIDKYGILIPLDKINKIKGCTYNPHVKVQYLGDKLKLTVSSKVVMEKNKFGCINQDNIVFHPEIIFNATGYVIDLETILSSPLFWFDVKTDTFNNTGIPNKDVLSSLRERANAHTQKQEVIAYKDFDDVENDCNVASFDKKMGYLNSVVIRSTAKTVKDSTVIYDKIKEIKANKWHGADYYNNFSEDYLLEHGYTLRFERRFQSSKDIIKAHHFTDIKQVTLRDIFNSDVDVVAEKVNQTFFSRKSEISIIQNTTDKAVANYLKEIGINEALKQCDNNIKAFKIHLRRVLNLDKSVNLYNIGKQAEAILSNSQNKCDDFEILVDKFLEENFGGSCG